MPSQSPANRPAQRCHGIFITAVLIAVLLSAAQSHGQSLIKVPFPYSPINTSALPFMIAKDAKIFEKYGLDVDLIFIGAAAT